MTTITDLVNEIERDHLVPFSRPEYDRLSSASDAATSLVLANTDALLTGATLNTNFELVHVLGYNRNNRTASVIRGHLGSTASAIAADQVVRVNPRFSDVAIQDAIIQELESWDERLYKVEQDSLSFGVYDSTIEATPTAQPYRVLEAWRRSRFDFDYRQRVNVSLRRNQEATQFASGYAVSVPGAFYNETTVDVLYAVPFTTAGITPTTDLNDTVGLERDMLEVLRWGALWRLLAGREAVRVDQTVHHRQELQQNVPAGANIQVAERYLKLRNDRYNECAKKLLARYPYRMVG